MLTHEQRAIRRTGITSSDITRIVGESPWGGPCDVYLEKTTDVSERSSTLQQRIGDYLEPLVCELIAEKFDLPALTQGRTVRHPILPWALSTPDRVAPGRGVVEAKVKSVTFSGRELWMDDEAPPPFVHVQAQWHMLVTLTDRCFVGALLGGLPRFWLVENDQDLAAVLLEEGQRFHEDHVVARVPPSPDGSPGARRMLAAVWPKSKAETLRASPEAEQAARAYFESSKALKQVEQLKEQAAQDLIAFAQDFGRVEGDGWRLTLAEQDARHVEAYDTKPYRRFDLRAMATRKGKAA